MEIIGKVIQILPLQEGTSKTTNKPWAVQSFVIETLENYSKKVCIELFGTERVQQNPIVQDQIYTISFDLESREFNGRWYTSVRAWKVVAGSNPTPAAPIVPESASAATAPTGPGVAATAPFDASASEDSSLPF